MEFRIRFNRDTETRNVSGSITAFKIDEENQLGSAHFPPSGFHALSIDSTGKYLVVAGQKKVQS